MSDGELDSEWDLTRWADLPGREAGPRDSAEGRAAHDVTGWTEIGMIEQIEDIHAEMEVDAGADSDSPHHREIHVVERRADDDVTAQGAEPIHGSECRR